MHFSCTTNFSQQIVFYFCWKIRRDAVSVQQYQYNPVESANLTLNFDSNGFIFNKVNNLACPSIYSRKFEVLRRNLSPNINSGTCFKRFFPHHQIFSTVRSMRELSSSDLVDSWLEELEVRECSSSCHVWTRMRRWTWGLTTMRSHLKRYLFYKYTQNNSLLLPAKS